MRFGCFSLCLVWLLLGCSGDKTSAPAASQGSGSATNGGSAALPPADDRYAADALGALTFYLSEGSPAARAHFQRGLLALHSFWYDEAQRQFTAAIAADPSMNMAHWGLAMSYLKLLWGDDDVQAARTALSKMPDPRRLSDREQGWVMATVALLKPEDVRTSRKDFVTALERLNQVYPDDETATFVAVALLSTTRPEDPDTIAVRERAAGLAGEVFKRNPKHPGAAHYMIHAFDTPQLAPRALAVAKAYAQLAPAAFHARHMPAHIFSRLGMWQDAITSCQSAWDASVASTSRYKLPADHKDFHSLSWLVDMPFEIGHRTEADAALKKFASEVRAGLTRQNRSLYVTQVGSYLERTGEWQRADELLEPLSAAPSGGATSKRADIPGGSATHCGGANVSPDEVAEQNAATQVRALAMAMLRDAAKAKPLIAQLEAGYTQLRGSLTSIVPPDQIKTLATMHERYLQRLRARASGDDRALLKVLRASAADAGSETGGESNPSAYVVREQIADALVRLGDVKGARAEYALVLEQHPGRTRALLRAARAATKAGDAGAARDLYTRFLEKMVTAEPGTEGLDEAKAAVAR